VDVVFTSHNHWYERFHPSACATQGDPDSDSACSVGSDQFAAGTVYYVTGGAGAFTIPGMLCGSETGRAKCSGDHHYILVEIQDHVATLQTWAAFPQTNQVIDSIVITKETADCDGPVGPDAGGPDAGASDAGISDAGTSDAGPGPDGGGGPDAGPAPDAAPADASVAPDAPGTGCGCHTGGGPGPLPLLLLSVVLALHLGRRRRGR
jgi:MYXO-CTERM domain-containing protein